MDNQILLLLINSDNNSEIDKDEKDSKKLKILDDYLKIDNNNSKLRNDYKGNFSSENDTINRKQKKLSNFLKERDEGIKLIENERYHDQMDIYKRQQIYEKMLSNYDKKIYTTKKQQQEQTRSKTLNPEKISELNEQIKDYERKNKAYKRKIENIFDLKEKQEMEDKKVMSEKKFNIHRPDLGIRKLADLEKKLELERFRRENALINNVNNIQDKINKILVKKEEKEKNILKTKESEEKKREEKLMLNNLKFEEVRNNVKKNQEKLEEKRNLKLKSLEKK